MPFAQDTFAWLGAKFIHMAENFGHLSSHGSSGFFQSIIKMAYEITKLYLNSDGITKNTRTITTVFQFANVEHHSTTFQRYFSETIYRKMNSIPFPRNDINLPLIRSSQGLTNHRQNNQITYLIGINKKSKDATLFAKLKS